MRLDSDKAITYDLTPKTTIFDISGQSLTALESVLSNLKVNQVHGYKPVVAGSRKMELSGKGWKYKPGYIAAASPVMGLGFC